MREGPTQTETGRMREEEMDRETDGEWRRKVEGRKRERKRQIGGGDEVKEG